MRRNDLVGRDVTTLRPQLTPSGYHESAGELRGLTGLRIVAAAWVVFFHFHFTPLPGVARWWRSRAAGHRRARWASTCSSCSAAS